MDSGSVQGFVGIYFVQDESGPVKIGYGSDPIARLRSLQAGNPRELSVIGWFEAPVAVERQLHARLIDHRIRGEWFECCDEVLDALAECIVEYGKPECSVCDREARYVLAGFDVPKPDGPHRCGVPLRSAGSA